MLKDEQEMKTALKTLIGIVHQRKCRVVPIEGHEKEIYMLTNFQESFERIKSKKIFTIHLDNIKIIFYSAKIDINEQIELLSNEIKYIF